MERHAPEPSSQVCRAILDLVPCDRILVGRCQAGTEAVVYRILHPDDPEAPVVTVPLSGSRAARVLEHGQAEIQSDLRAGSRFSDEKALHDLGLRSAAFLPLMSPDGSPGVLVVASAREGFLDEERLRFLERAGGLLAAALAADASQPLARQIEAYGRVSAQIVQQEDLQIVCRAFLEAVRDHSGFRRAVLTLVDESDNDFQWFFAGFTDAEIDRYHTSKMTPDQRAALFQKAYRRGQAYVVPAAIRRGLVGLRPLAPGEGDAAGGDLFVVPLYGAGAVLVGTLMFDQPVVPGGPGPESLASLELFAGQVAHAVEKKRLERAVRSAQSRLRSAQEQLNQAEKMSAIGQLISGVTHELNNPLSGIMGFAQLLLSSELNSKSKKHLERIFTEAVRCQKIVQNLLSFARRHKPEKSSQNLNQLIDGVLELRAYQLQVDNVEVDRRYDPALPATMLDFHQMQQVVLNVVNNAHQAMMATSGRPRRLTITTGSSEGRLHARFTDTGTGIAPERLGQIFEPFYTTKEPGKGTGLGLSLSRTIVTEHQGAMKAESVLGEGTTISVEIPLLEGEAAAPAPPEAPKAAAARLKPLRLLVVDDEEVLTELLGDFLESEGHTVGRARDGRAALQLAKANDYDAILTDLKMPGLDGQGLYEHVCRLKPEMRGRFIFSTGDLANARVQTFFQSNGCLYLSKPFKLESILAALDQMIRRQRAA